MNLKPWLLMIGFSTAVPVWGQSLALKDYLDQVAQKNGLVQSARSQADGAAGLAREAELIYAPTFFADAKTGFDEKAPTLSAVSYDKATLTSYSVGLQKQFGMGLNAKLSFEVADNAVSGIPASAGIGDKYQFAESAAKLELGMPLWGGGFGRGVRANEELLRQQNLGSQYQALSQLRTTLVNAEAAYWKLAAAAENQKIQEQSLKNAKSILDYVTGKRRRDLGETADVLQAQALVESTNMQVQVADNNLRAAQRQFNLFLNQESSAPTPKLDGLNFKNLAELAAPVSRPGDLYSVKSSVAQASAARANSVVAAERNKPKLDVYGTYNSYGQSSDVTESMRDSYKFERDGAFVGLKLSIPLDRSAANAALAGARANEVAAEQNVAYLQYAQEQQWTDIVQNFADAKKTLVLFDAIEKAQRAKLENEQERLKRGRTTTYQVLLFEQEYNLAQNNRIQAATSILNLQAQMKMYEATTESEK